MRPPSLIEYTVELLRAGLVRGEWGLQLPGERELCVSLQVSRPTLRAALSVLEKEGWITARQGLRRTVLRSTQGRGKTKVPAAVALLSALPLQEFVSHGQVWKDEFCEVLSKAGYEVQMHCGRKWFGRTPQRELEALVRRSRVAAWMLFVSTPAMQKWFEASGERAVVAGSLHPGIQLPSVDLDHRAACRHAAGRLLALGHRHLVFVRQNPGLAGDLESEAGFREGIESVAGATVAVAEMDGSPHGIQKTVRSLLRRTPAPTGFLVARTNAVLAVTSELIRTGVSVPGQVSVISRDSDRFLDYFSPAIARYARDSKRHARSAARLLLQCAEGVVVPGRKVRLMPSFFAGASLGPPG